MGVLTGHLTRENFAAEGAHLVLESVADLPGAIADLPGAIAALPGAVTDLPAAVKQ